MAKRKRIPPDVETSVLAMSRRRCCLCFALNRDSGIKKGQIAHLDQDSSNAALDNLAYLCFDHHDQYDSRTSQAKNVTLGEVRRYRTDLHEAIERVWKEPPSLVSVAQPPSASVAGHYIRESVNDTAELTVAELGDGKIHVIGFALWGLKQPFGPHLGELDFETVLENATASFVKQTENGRYTLKLQFLGAILRAEEQYAGGMFGMNVTFGGEYHQVSRRGDA